MEFSNRIRNVLESFPWLVCEINNSNPVSRLQQIQQNQGFPFFGKSWFCQNKNIKVLFLLSKGGFDISGHGLLLHLFLFRELYQMGAEVAHI